MQKKKSPLTLQAMKFFSGSVSIIHPSFSAFQSLRYQQTNCFPAVYSTVLTVIDSYRLTHCVFDLNIKHTW